MTFEPRGIGEKILRASQHLEHLHSWLPGEVEKQKGSFRLEGKYGRNRATYIFEAQGLWPIPIRAGIEFGDIIHNLRSALDHIAWQLVKNGIDPSHGHPNQVQFPIYANGREFRKNYERRLPGVRGKRRAIVDLCQPYHRGERPHALAQLADFSNMDKHRVPNLVLTFPQEFQPKVTILGEGRIVDSKRLLSYKRPVGNGTKVLRVVVDPPGTKVNVETGLALYEAFEDGTNLWSGGTRMVDRVFQVFKGITETFDVSS